MSPEREVTEGKLLAQLVQLAPSGDVLYLYVTEVLVGTDWVGVN